MIDLHIRKLRARSDISAAEEEIIRSGVREIMKVPADQLAARAHRPLDFSTILVTGIAARQKDMRSGKRQIMEIHVPGDFTDLHSFTLKYLDHDVVALTDCTLAVVPHDHLQQITETQPHLTRVYWFATNLDAAIHREWEVSLGSRGAVARMAHLFCELMIRMDLVGLVQGNSYDLPITQQDLAEMLGITPVHANRILQELRAQDAVEFTGGVVTIKDAALLKRIAEFDPSYLYLEPQRRR